MANLQETFRDWSDEMRTDIEERSERARTEASKFIRSLPYAAIGSTVHNVERTREIVKAGFELPTRVLRSTAKSPEALREAYEARVERGRRVVDRVSHRDAVGKAADDLRSATKKSKGVAASLRQVARDAAAAVEDAAEAVFDPQDVRPYESRTLTELRELASERGIAGRSAMNKKQLIKAIRKHR